MLTQLRHIVESMTAAASLEQALQALVHLTRNVMQVDCCSVYVAEPERRCYRLAATDGLAESAVGKAFLPFEEGIVGLVGQREELINLADASAHPAFKLLPDVAEEAFRSFLGTPIMHQRQVVGILVVQQKESRLFDEGEESFLVTLAAQLAARIAHAQARSQLTRTDWGKPLRGVAGSPGVAIARAWVWRPRKELAAIVPRKADDPDAQLGRFDQAVEAVRHELEALALRFRESSSQDSVAIFDIYLHLLADPSYIKPIRLRIEQEEWTAISAVKLVSETLIGRFGSMQDPYLRERATDIKDIALRLISRLVQDEPEHLAISERVVLVAEEVTATILAEVPRDCLAGVVSIKGSSNSHTAILARAMGVPAIMGVEFPLAEIHRLMLVVDGYSGDLFVEPKEPILAEYRQLLHEEQALDQLVHSTDGQPSETLDGVKVSLLLNAGLSADTEIAINELADGVGLYRTEIPFMLHDSFPSEWEQTARYRGILETYRNRPVCMRTLDVGGDKQLPYFPIVEENPFLGWRGIRLTLDHPELFLVQLKAMLRASEGLDNLAVMLPMISSVGEIRAARRLLDQAWSEVSQEVATRGGTLHYPPLGVMIEVPSALYILPEMAPLIDFWSVGSNDLTQYLLAVDRNNARVASIYDSFHPAVIRALQLLVDSARRYGKPVSVCGELAGDPIGVLVLLAMGYRRFSMNTRNIPRIKYVLRNASLDELVPLLAEGLRSDSPHALRGLFSRYLEERGMGGFLRAGHKATA
ncbi:phosphoenolpyruvate--protein phosphotransferase [Aeromonas schubertii]|uniref:phosphoenolpyruvate--protein phosphotransferase n=1 Tax=Aeromonas schubertii TaxID=652 RepID=A0A0S2SFB2_9GAMM|nr:phosphoenolpyruvate--protein phosphotransferase [Aeromonas schubertii]ALP40362.1 phosphoenolpyruvate-protein phosphotransferase [Aeromonas schubertii]